MNGFKISFMRWKDVIKNSIKNISQHPIDFLNAEMRTKIMSNAVKGYISKNNSYTIPSLTMKELGILYARRR
jgi:hypothetical protein